MANELQRLAWIAGLAVLLAPAGAARAQFVEICGVPLAIEGAARQTSENRRERLLGRQISLIAEGERFNGDCGRVKPASDRYARCATRYRSLLTRRKALNENVGAACAKFRDTANKIMSGWAVEAMIQDHVEANDRRLREVLAKPWSGTGKTGFMLASLTALRGYLGQARRYLGLAAREAGDDELVKQYDALLTARAVAAAESQARDPFAFGGMDERLVEAGNAASQRLIWDAAVHLGRGDYDRAEALFRQAAGTPPSAAGTQAALNDAMVWARQLKVQRDARSNPRDRAAFYRARRDHAAAERAWALGQALALGGQTGRAREYYDEAQRYFAGTGKPPGRVVADQRADLIAGRFVADAEAADLLNVPTTRTQAVLDALEYGRGDWGRSLGYLDARLALSPENRHLLEARAYVEGLSANR
jgi:hypothetical protein